MANSMKIRAKFKNGITTVKILVKHVMESGTRIDKDSGEKIPAHFINSIQAEHNGEVITSADWGTGVSKNPYWSFEFEGGAPGEKIKINWVDNKGESDSAEAVIK